MKDDTRTRVLAEIQRLHHGIAECANCQAMRHQMAELHRLLPPDPIQNKADGLWYVFNPPPEYVALVERRLKELLPEIEKGAI